LISSSMCSMRSTKEQMRSPGIPAVSVMGVSLSERANR
jgi:hypothetical protein